MRAESFARRIGSTQPHEGSQVSPRVSASWRSVRALRIHPMPFTASLVPCRLATGRSTFGGSTEFAQDGRDLPSCSHLAMNAPSPGPKHSSYPLYALPWALKLQLQESHRPLVSSQLGRDVNTERNIRAGASRGATALPLSASQTASLTGKICAVSWCRSQV